MNVTSRPWTRRMTPIERATTSSGGNGRTRRSSIPRSKAPRRAGRSPNSGTDLFRPPPRRSGLAGERFVERRVVGERAHHAVFAWRVRVDVEPYALRFLARLRPPGLGVAEEKALLGREAVDRP